MEFWQHLLACLILITLLYPFFGVLSLLVLVSGFLIDIDHVITYFFKFKKIGSFKQINDYFRNITKTKNRQDYENAFRIFHSMEAVIIMIILSFAGEIFFVLMLGLIMHITMDVIHEKKAFGKLQDFSIISRLLKQKPL